MDIPLHKKVIFAVSIFAGVFSIGIGAGYLIDTISANNQTATVVDSTHTETVPSKQVPATTPPEISLTFTGDIKMSGVVKRNVRDKLDGDYEKVFGAAKTILQKGDITFGNFNGTFGINDPDRTDSKVASALRGAGFDIIGMSYGGYDRSLNNLIETSLTIDGNGIIQAGAGRSYIDAREPKIIEKNGQTVGYLTFTDNKEDWPLVTESDAGMLSANDAQLEEIIAEAKSKSDILVVAFNWADKATSHTLRQELLAHTAIDAGATIVVGHYGNNLHDIEYYHGGLIAYNLGNLIRGSGVKSSGIQGVILETGIRAGVINTLAAYGVIENQNGFIDSVKEISVESLIRDKGVIKGNIRDYTEIIESLPRSVTSQIVFHGPKVNKVAITIDDGWNPNQVKRALDVLSIKNAKATFFTVGAATDANRLNLVRAVTNGIDLGNHSDTHGWLTQMTDKQIKKEMEDWQKKLDSAIGRHYETAWFRPPFMAGFTGHTKTAEKVTAIAKEKSMRIALWNVDPFSGISMRANAPAITQFVVSNARPGSIILLHFTNEHMAALPDIIDGLRAKGLEPVTLSELMGE
jgi:poly-gamma-glutamate synthesis protein (capsule biosynthesis protein)